MRPFSTFHSDLDPESVQLAEVDRLASLATWGYLLLRPGMEFARQRSNFILGWQAAAAAGAALGSGASAGAVGRAGVPPLGSWMILPSLTTPATQTVLPSHDALYGAAHVELDLLGPVVVSVPANIDDRYYSVAVLDAHMNNVAHIGPRWTGNQAGDFLLIPPGFTGEGPEGVPVIHCSTVSICLYNRMLVVPDDTDLERVRAWQAGLRLTQLSSWGTVGAVMDDVDVSAFVHPEINGMTDAVEYLRIGLEHLARNPMVEQAQWLSGLIEDAGFEAAEADPGLRAAVESGVDEATRMLDACLTTWPRTNGWMVPDCRLGLPNSQVLKAAAFQQFQIGSNDSAESVYYFVDVDESGAPLDASDGARYSLTFSAQESPPYLPGGYWSLTMYGADSLLVANDLDRYALRPGLPGVIAGADGSWTITFSTASPDGDELAAWLPAPDGRFRLGMRLYYPSDPARNGSWMPPAVRRING